MTIRKTRTTEHHTPEAVVAGHVCLDIIPTFHQAVRSFGDLIAPGKLTETGVATITTGGAVSNTGLALHRLGVTTELMGKIGNDAFGKAITDVIGQYGAQLTAGMIVEPSAVSSYTVVLSTKGLDRSFLHCPGANDTFGANDIPYSRLAGRRLFHFGYPPLMRRMYTRKGQELAHMLQLVTERGLTTSLDMALPDPASAAGRQDWLAILDQALPFVDVFLPSFDEIRHMLAPVLGKAAMAPCNGATLHAISDALLERGVAIVAIKLGVNGLYVRTSADSTRLARMGRAAPRNPATWLNRELLAPCFKVRVAGTVGAGDCTIAGFLAGMLRNCSIEQTTTLATAVGAFNVEKSDAVSGVPALSTVRKRMAAGWKHLPSTKPGPGWTWNKNAGLWIGPA